MEESLFSLLAQLSLPLGQDDHFRAANLKQIFHHKIVRSQATGKDGVKIGRFEERLSEEVSLIEARVSEKTYRFTTYKERLILRGASRAPRQISIPTVRDRLTLRALCEVLHSFVPETRGGSPHSLIKKIVSVIRAGDQTSKVFLRIDVKDFYPSVAHLILARELKNFDLSQNVRDLCLAAVRTSTGAAGAVNSRGIPQGLSVSGALAALYMIKFDNSQISAGKSYFRYVDDILFVCERNEAAPLLKAVSRKLKARGLIVHPQGVAGKTEISPVENGIDFLGYNISIDKVSIRDSSYKRMFHNVIKVITQYKHGRDLERLIFKLNVKISGCIVGGGRHGWMMFFSYTQDISQLSFLDRFVKDQLLRVGFPAARFSEIKKFVKSYHEIRYNLQSTSYIPNFDSYETANKEKVITAMSRHRPEEVSAWDVDTIDREFRKIIAREVKDLERDVGQIS